MADAPKRRFPVRLSGVLVLATCVAWAVAVYVDSQLCRVYNARGSGREWNSIDKLGAWLREQGFWYWWTRNDLEPVGNAMADDEETQDLPSPAFVDPPFSPF